MFKKKRRNTGDKQRDPATHHAISGHRRRGRVVDVRRLEDDLAARGHRDPVAVSQGQGLVVIEDGIQVLDPDGVDGAIEDQPDVLSWNGGFGGCGWRTWFRSLIAVCLFLLIYLFYLLIDLFFDTVVFRVWYFFKILIYRRVVSSEMKNLLPFEGFTWSRWSD